VFGSIGGSNFGDLLGFWEDSFGRRSSLRTDIWGRF